MFIIDIPFFRFLDPSAIVHICPQNDPPKLSESLSARKNVEQTPSCKILVSKKRRNFFIVKNEIYFYGRPKRTTYPSGRHLWTWTARVEGGRSFSTEILYWAKGFEPAHIRKVVENLLRDIVFIPFDQGDIVFHGFLIIFHRVHAIGPESWDSYRLTQKHFF